MPLALISVQPDFFCREDNRANIGGPFCGRCGRGIMAPAGQGTALMWCYGCGFATGALPLIEIPLGWADFADAITFAEAQRMKLPGFDALSELDKRDLR